MVEFRLRKTQGRVCTVVGLSTETGEGSLRWKQGRIAKMKNIGRVPLSHLESCEGMCKRRGWAGERGTPVPSRQGEPGRVTVRSHSGCHPKRQLNLTQVYVY